MVIFIASVTVCVAQGGLVLKRKTGTEEPYYKNKWYFAICLSTSDNGFVRWGILKVHQDGTKEVTWLNKDVFNRQAAGYMESKANPGKINYFEENKIKWDVYDELWKVRYSEYPYKTTQTMPPGWAGKMFAPSDAQWSFLKQNYGYGSLNDLIFGDNLWKFLKDVQDPEWVAHYSGLK